MCLLFLSVKSKKKNKTKKKRGSAKIFSVLKLLRCVTQNNPVEYPCRLYTSSSPDVRERAGTIAHVPASMKRFRLYFFPPQKNKNGGLNQFHEDLFIAARFKHATRAALKVSYIIDQSDPSALLGYWAFSTKFFTATFLVQQITS